MASLAFHVTTTMNRGGKFGLSEKYRFCHMACNYRPDYPHATLFQWLFLLLRIAGLRDRRSCFILLCMYPYLLFSLNHMLCNIRLLTGFPSLV